MNINWDAVWSVALSVGAVLLIVWILFAFVILYVGFKIRKWVTRMPSVFDTEPAYMNVDLRKSKKHERRKNDNTRDFLRMCKESEARDQETIDNATRFHRDF